MPESEKNLNDFNTVKEFLEKCIKHIENAEHPSRSLPGFIKEAKDFLNPPNDLIGEGELPF